MSSSNDLNTLDFGTKFTEFAHGWPTKKSPFIKDISAQIEALRKIEMREDDVIIAAFPKCGTHWVWEVVKMLRKGQADIEARTKEAVMLEFQDVDRLPAVAAEPSPRTLNSHNPFCHLPQQIVEKKVKILHVVRNPKDTLVSLFHHKKGLPTPGEDETTFEKMLEDNLANTMYMPHQFYYLRQMQTWQREHPNHPVMNITYEDMKCSPLEVTIKIAKFLALDVTSQFCQDVVDACSFDNMKSADSDREKPSFLQGKMNSKKMQIYRKGIIGDWKNAFTVAQNEAMDAFIKQESQGLDFTFTYE